MKVLSLFDGMSCGMLAFQRADVPMDRYVAYEIDKYAIQVSTHNFPMIEQRGDVFKADFTEFEGFDAVVGGSPYTYWSIAQTKNRETEAHGIGWELFQQYVRAIREAKPKFFIYENNKSMAQAIKEEISNTFGFEPIMINSALVSAQNRQRYYWVGIRQEDGTYRKANIEQPIDRGIVLRDVLDDYQRGHAQMVAEPVNVTSDGKTHTLKAQYYKNGIANFVTNGGFGATGVAEPIGAVGNMYGKGQNGQLYGLNSKTKTLSAGTGQTGNGIGSNNSPKAILPYPEYNGNPIYEVKDGHITIKDKQYPIKLADGFYVIRKLTVSECKRLQTVPEDYDMSVISNTQAYKCLGNGWTVDVIAHLVEGVMKELEE